MSSTTLNAGKHTQDTQLINTVQLWLNSLTNPKGKHTQKGAIIQIENNHPQFTPEADELLEKADELLGLRDDTKLVLKTGSTQITAPAKIKGGRRLQVKQEKASSKINWNEKKAIAIKSCSNILKDLKQKKERAVTCVAQQANSFYRGCTNILRNIKVPKIKPAIKHKVINIEEVKEKHKPKQLIAKACIFLSSMVILQQGAVAVKNYREAKEKEALEAAQTAKPIPTPKIINIMYDIALENCKTKAAIDSYVESKINYNALDFSKRNATLQDKLQYIYQEYNLSAYDFQVLVAVVRQEAGDSYQEAYNVISNLSNRIKSKQWVNNYPNGRNLIAQVKRSGQYGAYIDGNYKQYMSNYKQLNAFDAVVECLITQKTSHKYKSFQAPCDAKQGVQLYPGGNVYYHELTSSDLLSLNVKSFNDYMDEKFYEDLKQQIIDITQKNLKHCLTEDLQALIDPYIEILTQNALTSYKNGMSTEDIANNIANIIQDITRNYLYGRIDTKTHNNIMEEAAKTTLEVTKGMDETMRQSITSLYERNVYNVIEGIKAQQTYKQAKKEMMDSLREYMLENNEATPTSIIYDLDQGQTRTLTLRR
ncbi:MAG: hypothetical protein K2M17_05380 [Bacilli bacterium]|nr:hypothetical protein [Bacilli bacterium]